MFEYLWRNKFLTVEAKSIDEMIAIYQSTTDLFREMRDAGVVLDVEGGGVQDDYALLLTDDPAVAARFDFDPEYYEEEEEESEPVEECKQ